MIRQSSIQLIISIFLLLINIKYRKHTPTNITYTCLLIWCSIQSTRNIKSLFYSSYFTSGPNFSCSSFKCNACKLTLIVVLSLIVRCNSSAALILPILPIHYSISLTITHFVNLIL